jgi:methionyl aminopeptidase
VQNYVEKNGYSVVRDFVGHGIGTELWEAPQVPNYVTKERGPRLTPGMTIAVEPMVNEGTFEVKALDNKWTVVTADGKLSAHYENTIAITDGDPIIMTKLRGESF